jgi:mannose-1-phosphate guanylyltransferase
MIYAVIMAGGSGTRFWPLSRESMPKQFLAIGEPQALLKASAERMLW